MSCSGEGEDGVRRVRSGVSKLEMTTTIGGIGSLMDFPADDNNRKVATRLGRASEGANDRGVIEGMMSRSQSSIRCWRKHCYRSKSIASI